MNAESPKPLKCPCGWPRPLIALTNVESDAPPPDGIVPVYLCPVCAMPYCARELTPEQARALFATLRRRLS